MRLALATLALCLTATVTLADTVGRFGVTGHVPPGFTAGPAPGNDDGRTFTAGDGGELRLWGSWRIEPIAADRKATRGYLVSEGANITYEADGRGWFVISGYLGSDIFYLRVEDGITCGGEEARAHLRLLYPIPARDRYDPLVGTIAKSLGFGPC